MLISKADVRWSGHQVFTDKLNSGIIIIIYSLIPKVGIFTVKVQLTV